MRSRPDDSGRHTPAEATWEDFDHLVAAVADYAIILLDADGNVARWNAGARRIKGYEASEIVGRHFSVFYPQEAIDRGWPAVELATAKAEGRFEDEGWRIRRDGSRFWANVVITALYTTEGQLRGFLKITRDLTERKEAEERLRSAHAELEQRVRERTMELTRLNAVLREENQRRRRLEEDLREQVRLLAEADRQKNEFLATLAHELRNPLAPIRNCLHVVRSAAGDVSTTERALSTIDRQLGQLVHLVDDLLDLSRVTQGRIALRKDHIDLNEVLKGVVEACQGDIRERGHSLEVVLPPDAVELQGDSTRLSQVFGNLLTNAAKFTSAGGTIRLDVERDGDHVVVKVSDTGIGIPVEMQPRIFDMFFQVDGAIDRGNAGLGIGLTLARRLVELHGGTIEVQSDGIGRGATFSVRLLAPASSPGDRERDRDPDPGNRRNPFRNRRVLVADDNRDNADSIAEILRILGADVRAVYDGTSAIALGEQFEPDVALLDIGMPGFSGYETARAIRATHWGRRVLLVAMTGWGREEDRRRSLEAGFDRHLVKPIDLQDLERSLRDETN